MQIQEMTRVLQAVAQRRRSWSRFVTVRASWFMTAIIVWDRSGKGVLLAVAAAASFAVLAFGIRLLNLRLLKMKRDILRQPVRRRGSTSRLLAAHPQEHKDEIAAVATKIDIQLERNNAPDVDTSGVCDQRGLDEMQHIHCP